MNGTLDSRITFTRASSATYWDHTGTLQSVGTNAPRFEYSTSTGSLLGLLCEEQRTNYIRNPRCEGAVAGTPGTLPNYWAWEQPGGSGISSEVVGSGTDSGIPYVDIRIYGTTNTSSYVALWADTQTAPASLNQTWTLSSYVKIVGGGLTNIGGWTVDLEECDGSGNELQDDAFGVSAPTTSFTRYTVTKTTTNSSVGSVRARFWQFGFSSNSQPFDVTFRLGAPQLEQGDSASSIILPPSGSPAVTTRAADYPLIESVAGWLSPQMGTIVCDFIPRQSSSVVQGVFQLSDGTVNNLVQDFIYSNDTTQQNFEIKEGSSGTFQSGSGAVNGLSIGNKNTAGITWSSAGAITDANGNLYQPTGSVNVPIMSELSIGYGNGWLNGWVQKLKYWPRFMSATELSEVAV